MEYDTCLLRSDYSITCDGHDYALVRVLGVLAVLVYGVGVPLSYALLLATCRRAIRDGQPTKLSSALNFLHGALHPSALWWPLIEASRALILTGVLALGPGEPGSLTQLICGVAAASGFAMLQVWWAPYLHPSNNLLALVESFSLAMYMLGLLGVQANSHGLSPPVDRTLLTVALLVTAFAVFGLTLLSVVARCLSSLREPTHTATNTVTAPLVVARFGELSVNMAAAAQPLAGGAGAEG